MGEGGMGRGIIHIFKGQYSHLVADAENAHMQINLFMQTDSKWTSTWIEFLWNNISQLHYDLRTAEVSEKKVGGGIPSTLRHKTWSFCCKFLMVENSELNLMAAEQRQECGGSPQTSGQ